MFKSKSFDLNNEDNTKLPEHLYQPRRIRWMKYIFVPVAVAFVLLLIICNIDFSTDPSTTNPTSLKFHDTNFKNAKEKPQICMENYQILTKSDLKVDHTPASLILTNCSFNYIKDGVFDQPNFHKLLKLELINTQLLNLTKKTFAGLQKLQNFTLLNKSAALKCDSFMATLAKTLLHATIQQQYSEHYIYAPQQFFGTSVEYKNLKNLNLSGNNFGNTLRIYWFYNMPALETISLNDCRFTHIDNDYRIDKLCMLRLLNLSGNSFLQISTEFVRNLVKRGIHLSNGFTLVPNATQNLAAVTEEVMEIVPTTTQSKETIKGFTLVPNQSKETTNGFTLVPNATQNLPVWSAEVIEIKPTTTQSKETIKGFTLVPNTTQRLGGWSEKVTESVATTTPSRAPPRPGPTPSTTPSTTVITTPMITEPITDDDSTTNATTTEITTPITEKTTTPKVPTDLICLNSDKEIVGTVPTNNYAHFSIVQHVESLLYVSISQLSYDYTHLIYFSANSTVRSISKSDLNQDVSEDIATISIQEFNCNTSYVFCLLQILDTSPFNCQSHHTMVCYNANSTWFERNSVLIICLGIVGILLSVVFGGFTVYAILWQRPSWLCGSKRLQRTTRDSLTMLLLPENYQKEVYGATRSKNSDDAIGDYVAYYRHLEQAKLYDTESNKYNAPPQESAPSAPPKTTESNTYESFDLYEELC